MTISHAKSKAILICKDKGSEVMKRRFIRRTQQGRVLRFAHPVEHRLQTGRANFWRLHRVLRGKHALSRSNRVNIWRTCVRTASTYGLTACGLTCKGARKLSEETMKQVRLVVGDHVFMTKHSHKTVLERWGIMHPVQDLRKRMEIEELQDDQLDPFTKGKHSNCTPLLSLMTLPSPQSSHAPARPRECRAPPAECTSSTERPCSCTCQNDIMTIRNVPVITTSPSTKHIQEKRCPKLFGQPGNDVPANASDVGADLAPAQAASPSSVNLPYAQRPYVEVMTTYGVHLPDRHVFTHQCALWHHGITEPRNMKQHYRL